MAIAKSISTADLAPGALELNENASNNGTIKVSCGSNRVATEMRNPEMKKLRSLCLAEIEKNRDHRTNKAAAELPEKMSTLGETKANVRYKTGRRNLLFAVPSNLNPIIYRERALRMSRNDERSNDILGVKDSASTKEMSAGIQSLDAAFPYTLNAAKYDTIKTTASKSGLVEKLYFPGFAI